MKTRSYGCRCCAARVQHDLKDGHQPYKLNTTRGGISLHLGCVLKISFTLAVGFNVGGIFLREKEQKLEVSILAVLSSVHQDFSVMV